MSDRATRVLIVDDDPLSRELVTEFLEGAAYLLECAVDGQEAWELLDSHGDQLDVVVLDRMMPRMNGMELLRRLKRDPRLTSLPVIMQTAVADRKSIIDGINAGAFYYLTKPFDGEMLVSIVDAAASDHERYRELQRQVRQDAGTLGLMRSGEFRFRTIDEALALGAFLAKTCPDAERVVIGLSELLANAVEHGNLEISYEEKSELKRSGVLAAEVSRRLADPRYGERTATVRFDRSAEGIRFVIDDQGPGFDPEPYLRIDPTRVFDSHGRGIAIANMISFDHLEYCRGGREALAVVRVEQASSD